MIDASEIRAIADRVQAQVRQGVAAWRSGDVLQAELHLSMADMTLRQLQMRLDTPAKPLRTLCLVGDRAPADPDDADLQPWMETAHEDPDGSAA